MRILRKMGVMLLILFGLVILAVLLFVPFHFPGDSEADTENIAIIAHRGASSIAPENTMPAIEMAMESGAGYIEIDVQLCKDRKLVLMHDKDVNRTTNGEGLVSELEWSYLSTLDARYKFDISYKGTKIPLLEEVLQKVDGRVRLLIEIKDGKGMEGIADEVVSMIQKYNAGSWCEVQSFSDNILNSIQRIEPGIRLHKLFVMKLRFLPIIFDGSFTSFSYEKYDFIYAFNIHHRFGNNSFLNEIHDNGKKAHAWGCSKITSCALDRMGRWDGIITDHPGNYINELK